MTTPNRFLIVDDDLINNKLCGFAISRCFGDSNITSYTEPEKALLAIESGIYNEEINPAVIFLDINMPTMTGWEFLDAFQFMDSTVQKQYMIYILTSSVDTRDREKALENSFIKGFISKPLTLENIEKIFVPAS